MAQRDDGHADQAPRQDPQLEALLRPATTGDRFIPNRAAMDISVSNFELTRDRENPENADVNASPAKEEYKKELAANLFAGSSTNKVLAFSLVTVSQSVSHYQTPTSGAHGPLHTLGLTCDPNRTCNPRPEKVLLAFS